MSRPSLKDVRSNEILHAFAGCVARYGLEGSTLEKISEAAGVKRTILRHYLGNREQMVEKLIEYVVNQFNNSTDELIAYLPETNRVKALLDTLFYFENSSPVSAAIFQAFVAASDRHPQIRAGLLEFITRFEAAITLELAKEYPKASSDTCTKVSAAITALYFNADATAPLKPSQKWLKTQRESAELLLNLIR